MIRAFHYFYKRQAKTRPQSGDSHVDDTGVSECESPRASGWSGDVEGSREPGKPDYDRPSGLLEFCNELVPHLLWDAIGDLDVYVDFALGDARRL